MTLSYRPLGPLADHNVGFGGIVVNCSVMLQFVIIIATSGKIISLK